MMRRTGALALAVVLAGIILLSACEPAPTPDTYVSIGDSMVAGPGVPEQIVEAGACLRSTQNLGHKVEPLIGVSRLVDVSCSGATTRDLLDTQLAAVDARTKVLTITIGYNDIDYSGIVTTCTPVNTCTAGFVHDGRDVISERIAAYAPKLDAVLVEAKRRAPQAVIVVVPYVPLFATGAGCLPSSPLPWDLPYLQAKFAELNATMKARALANGARYVDAVANATGHDICSADRWIEGIIPTSVAAPYHPNAAGFAGMAPLVAATINQP